MAATPTRHLIYRPRREHFKVRSGLGPHQQLIRSGMQPHMVRMVAHTEHTRERQRQTRTHPVTGLPRHAPGPEGRSVEYYPFIAVTLFSVKTGKSIWYASGVGCTNNSDVRISSQALFFRISSSCRRQITQPSIFRDGSSHRYLSRFGELRWLAYSNDSVPLLEQANRHRLCNVYI